MSQKNAGNRPPERRATQRAKLDLDAEVRISDRTHSMRVLDASEGGMLLCAPLRPIHVERFQHVEVVLHGPTELPPLPATVVRVIDEGNSSSDEFLSGFAVKLDPDIELDSYQRLLDDALPSASDATPA